MSDAVADLRAAQGRRDLPGTAKAVLRINGPDAAYQVAHALLALSPFLDEATQATVEPYLGAALTPGEPTPRDEYSTEPVDVVAWLSEGDRYRAWEQLIQMSQWTRDEAAAMVDVPLELLPELLPALFDVGKHIAPKLGPFDERLRAYHLVAPVASQGWFLQWIGTTGRLVPKVTSAPAWTAAVHSPAELTELVNLIIANRRP